MTEKKKGSVVPYRVLFIVIVSVIVVISIILILTARTEEPVPVKAGCLFSGSISEEGWIRSNFEGLSEACAQNGVKLEVKENVAENEADCISAVNELAAEGCTVIFLPGSEYIQFLDRLSDLFRGVRFYTGGVSKEDDLSAFCSGRMYQVRYLSGIIAGLTTKSNVVGYVAAKHDNEVIRGINAFTLGAQSINPYVSVKVIFTGSWDDAQAETAAVHRLAELSADVIAYHQDRENVPRACEEEGIDFIGTYKLGGSYSEHCLTSMVCSWDKIYGAVLRDVMSRRAGGGMTYWLGIENGTVSLAKYSENVSNRARYEVMFAVNRMEAGRSIFSGEIYDTDGVLRCAQGEVLSDRTLLLGMDWFVQGVEAVEDK